MLLTAGMNRDFGASGVGCIRELLQHHRAQCCHAKLLMKFKKHLSIHTNRDVF